MMPNIPNMKVESARPTAPHRPIRDRNIMTTARRSPTQAMSCERSVLGVPASSYIVCLRLVPAFPVVFRSSRDRFPELFGRLPVLPPLLPLLFPAEVLLFFAISSYFPHNPGRAIKSQPCVTTKLRSSVRFYAARLFITRPRAPPSCDRHSARHHPRQEDPECGGSV